MTIFKLKSLRSVQTVSIANSSHSEHIRSVHLVITSGHSVLRFVCLIDTDRKFLVICHKAKQARLKSNVPCSISQIPKRARFKHIPRPLSYKSLESRF